MKVVPRAARTSLPVVLSLVALLGFASCAQLFNILGVSTPPPMPLDFKAAALSASQIKLTWTTNSTDIDYWSLERAEGSAGTFEQLATPAGTSMSYTDSGLTAGTLYRYRLRAANSAGFSPYSTAAQAVTPLASSVPALELATVGSRFNTGTLGDGVVEARFTGLDPLYDLQARATNTAALDPPWLTFPVGSDGSCPVELPLTAFAAGTNTLQFRYAYTLSAETGAVAEQVLYRGAYDGAAATASIDAMVDITSLTIGSGSAPATDAILQLDLQTASVPWITASSILLLPAADGSLSVKGVDTTELFRLVGDFANYEYFSVILYARQGTPLRGNLAIRPSTGATLKTKVMITEGGVHRPYDIAQDGKAIVVLVRQEDNQSLINASTDILLDGTDPRYNTTTGAVTLSGLAGGTEYGLLFFWPKTYRDGTWWDPAFAPSAGATLDVSAPPLGYTLGGNLDLPWILVQGTIDWGNIELWRYINDSLYASPINGQQWAEFRWTSPANIMRILTDAADALHDRTALVFADPRDLEAADPSGYAATIPTATADFETLGFSKTNYATSVEQWSSKLHGLPFMGGDTLGLYYRKSVHSDASVAALKADDLALAPTSLTFSWRESFWLLPWFNAKGGLTFYSKSKCSQAQFETAFKDALAYLNQLKARSPVQVPANAGDDYSTARSAFVAGSADFLINGDWDLPNLRTEVGADLGYAPLPSFVTGAAPRAFSKTCNVYITDTARAQLWANLLGSTFDATFWQNLIKSFGTTWAPPPMRAPALKGLDTTGWSPMAVAGYQSLQQSYAQPLPSEIKAFWDAIKAPYASAMSGDDVPAAATAAWNALP